MSLHIPHSTPHPANYPTPQCVIQRCCNSLCTLFVGSHHGVSGRPALDRSCCLDMPEHACKMNTSDERAHIRARPIEKVWIAVQFSQAQDNPFLNLPRSSSTQDLPRTGPRPQKATTPSATHQVLQVALQALKWSCHVSATSGPSVVAFNAGWSSKLGSGQLRSLCGTLHICGGVRGKRNAGLRNWTDPDICIYRQH